MNTKRFLLIAFAAILASLFLGACSGAPLAHSWSGVSADSEHAYLSGGPFVYAVDLKTGKEVWRFPAQADSKAVFYAAPVLTEDGQLLVGSAGPNHLFYSLDPKSGKENWNLSGAQGAWLASPLVLNDTIFAPNADGFLYMLALNGKPAADPLELGGSLWASPVSDGQTLYVASLDRHLHIINLSDFSNRSVILGGASPSAPALGAEGAYAASFDTSIQLVSPDGKTQPFAKTEDWVWGSPVLTDNALYYGDLKGNIVSIDRASGKQNWVVTRKDDSVTAGLLVVGERIYAAVEGKNSTDGVLLALDLDGKIVWEKTPGGKLYSPPAAAGDLVLVAPYQAEYALVAYDADGKLVWNFAPQK